ncbi:MAG: dihydroneopterin aldolase [Actinobacteria bacterium HGW-Actinobacteria-5]|nr:MAG: dihydroneopterin aldolase [Actinobacteria bacterium HGW-Actinobacteria-5]
MPDRIRVTGIEVTATHGVYAEEKVTPQLFVIDLVCSLRPRPEVDDLTTTVDYADLAVRVADAARSGSVDLIETLAERISGVCLADPRIAEVEVTVHKPQAPVGVPVADVAVTITRRNLT